MTRVQILLIKLLLLLLLLLLLVVVVLVEVVQIVYLLLKNYYEVKGSISCGIWKPTHIVFIFVNAVVLQQRNSHTAGKKVRQTKVVSIITWLSWKGGNQRWLACGSINIIGSVLAGCAKSEVG